MTNINKKVLETVQVDPTYFTKSDTRDQNLIMIFGYSLPVSACLAGFALYTVSSFLLLNSSIALVLGVLGVVLMFLHDRSMLSTSNNTQISVKLLISVLIASCFTVITSVEENYDELRTELVQVVDDKNHEVTRQMNAELEAIDKQKSDIMKDIEAAAAVYPQKRQLLADARRTLKSFKATEKERKQRVKDMYQSQYLEPNISQTDILALQISKLLSLSKDTLAGLMMAFIYFLFEALPALVRLALIGGTYMSIVANRTKRERVTREEHDNFDDQFMANDGDDITPLLDKKILDAKTDILNGTGDEVVLARWTIRKKLWEEKGIHPFFGCNMDDIDTSDIYGGSKNESAKETNFSKNGQEGMEEEAVPAFE